MYRIISFFTILVCGYNQGIAQDIYLRDSIVQEPTSILLKKIITEVNDNFVSKGYEGRINHGEVSLDVNYVIANYHIMKSEWGEEYPLIQKKKIKLLSDKKKWDKQ